MPMLLKRGAATLSFIFPSVPLPLPLRLSFADVCFLVYSSLGSLFFSLFSLHRSLLCALLCVLFR